VALSSGKVLQTALLGSRPLRLLMRLCRHSGSRRREPVMARSRARPRPQRGTCITDRRFSARPVGARSARHTSTARHEFARGAHAYPPWSRSRQKTGRVPPHPEPARYEDFLGRFPDRNWSHDQAPLTRLGAVQPVDATSRISTTPRSLRRTTDAKILNRRPGAFTSTNRGGRCEACAGRGGRRSTAFPADVAVILPRSPRPGASRRSPQYQCAHLNIAEVARPDGCRRGVSLLPAPSPAIENASSSARCGPRYLRRWPAYADGSPRGMQRLKLGPSIFAITRKSRASCFLLEPTAGLPRPRRPLPGLLSTA